MKEEDKLKTIKNKGITLIALVITIQVNCYFVAMERKFKENIEKTGKILYNSYVT